MSIVSVGCVPIVPAHSGFAEYFKSGVTVPSVTVTQNRFLSDYIDGFVMWALNFAKSAREEPKNVATIAEAISVNVTNCASKDMVDYQFARIRYSLEQIMEKEKSSAIGTS